MNDRLVEQRALDTPESALLRPTESTGERVAPGYRFSPRLLLAGAGIALLRPQFATIRDDR